MDMGSKAGPLADVFAKLKEQMLESIERIKADQAADETHKMYCDEQLAETTAKVQSIEAEIEKHTAKIDQKTSSSLRVKAEVANLQKELATMIKEKAEMDNLRQKEKADYDANKAETEMSLGQIKFALKVLRDFYGSYEKEHTGFSSSDGHGQGVMAMLEAVEGEFSTSLVKMTAAEEAAVLDYENESKAFEIGKIEKEQDIKYKTKEHIGLDNYVN